MHAVRTCMSYKTIFYQALLTTELKRLTKFNSKPLSTRVLRIQTSKELENACVLALEIIRIYLEIFTGVFAGKFV